MTVFEGLKFTGVVTAVSAVALITVLGFAGVANRVAAQSAAEAGSSTDSLLRNGIPATLADRVSIRVPDFPPLSGEYRINEDETISFPVVGRIKVTGKTPADLERSIAEEVRRRVGREVQVTMEVIDYKPVIVNGFVTRAGSIAWRPGYTVTHAEALAGGIFRPTDNRTALPADNERARASRAASELARVLVQIARLQAEKAGESKFNAPKELDELLSKAEARKLLAAQQAMLASRRAAHETRLKSLDRARKLGEDEIKALKSQMARLDEQLRVREEFSKSVKALNVKGLVRFERTLEEQSRIIDAEERRTNVIVALARIHASVSGVVRDLETIEQERAAGLDEEMMRLDREAAQYRIEVDSAKNSFRRLTGQNALGEGEQRGGPLIAYEVVRMEGGVSKTINAQPMTQLLPGDLLVVRLQETASQ